MIAKRTTEISAELHVRAARTIPFGTPSRYRGHSDVVMARAYGSTLEDVDGNRYVDLVSALGPMLHGNDPEPVLRAVRESLDSGVQYSAPHRAEGMLAERILGHLGWADRLIFANSGSEAVQQAIRIARATTGRRVILKFEGHYHGWLDPVYVNTTSSATSADVMPCALQVIPASPGSPVPTDILVARWDDMTALEQLMSEVGDRVAAVIMEPAAAPVGNRLPDVKHLNAISRLAHAAGALVIVDEVVTGFRFNVGGLCRRIGFSPDLATYAKALGSGIPIAAVAGTAEAFESVLDERLSIVGTYNASSMGVAAAHAVLEMCEQDPDLFDRVQSTGARLRDIIAEAARDAGLPVTVRDCASVVQLYVGVSDLLATCAAHSAVDKTATERVSRRLLEEGVYMLPRGLIFASTTLGERDLEVVSSAFRRAFAAEAAT